MGTLMSHVISVKCLKILTHKKIVQFICLNEKGCENV